MIFRRLLRWLPTASAAERASAAAALVRAYLTSPLSPDDVEAAEAAMTILLDDASPAVRLSLASALAASPAAPRHLVIALAGDQPEIAATILARSPILLDAELVDAAADADPRIEVAIAERRPLSAVVAAALAEVGSAAAAAALLGNDAADVPVFSLARIVERHGEDAVVRDLLLAREDLPLTLRQRLIADLSNVLGAFVTERSWLGAARARDVTRDALDRATLVLAETDDPEALEDLVAHLAASGQLNAVLVLRGLCAGNVTLLEEVLVRLSGLPRRRVVGIVRERSAASFRPLYLKAGLPADAYPAFQAALEVVLDTDMPDRPAGRLHYSRQVLERVLTRYRGFAPGESDHLLLLLRRYAAEAAREEARRFAEAAREEGDGPLLIAGPVAA